MKTVVEFLFRFESVQDFIFRDYDGPTHPKIAQYGSNDYEVMRSFYKLELNEVWMSGSGIDLFFKTQIALSLLFSRRFGSGISFL